MIQITLLTVAGLLFFAAMTLLGTWWRDETHARREFVATVSENARRRLSNNGKKSRAAENAAKIDQRMAELEVLISDPNSQRDARKAG